MERQRENQNRGIKQEGGWERMIKEEIGGRTINTKSNLKKNYMETYYYKAY